MEAPACLQQDDMVDEMCGSVRAVENILNYNFIDKTLLEKALTHPSYVKSESYQRLEFVGDAALGLAITNFAFLAYPELHPGDLSVIRAANISTEKLARVAVRHQLYNYVRHNSTALSHKVLINFKHSLDSNMLLCYYYYLLLIYLPIIEFPNSNLVGENIFSLINQ